MAAADTKNRERSRSRSPNRNSDWADNSKHSYQETAMEVAQPLPSLDNQSSPNHNPDTILNHSQKSPISSDVQGVALGNGQVDHEQDSNCKDDHASIEPLREDQPSIEP